MIGDALPEIFGDSAKGVLNSAADSAYRKRDNHIGTDHILLGLIESEPELLRSLGIDARAAEREIGETTRDGISDSPERLTALTALTPRAENLLKFSAEYASQRGDREITPAHLVYGILEEGEGIAAQALLNQPEGIISKSNVDNYLSER